jgi:hypothetical protein
MVKDYLTDQEIKKIEAFNTDKVLVGAIRKVLLQGLYTHGVIKKGEKINPSHNAAYHLASLAIQNPIPDEILGQHIRGQFAGINALKNAYDDLEKITSKVKPIKTPYNEAE